MGTISSSFLQSVVSTSLQNAGLTNNSNTNSTSSADSIGQPPDSRQLSPFAQMMSTLQQLQQSDPAKYKEVTQQISTNLQTAAQTALQNGNPTAANQLDQLAADFSDASQSGQLPNIKDLAAAVGGHHHHHHGGHAHADPDAATAGDAASASQSLSQILSAFQTGTTQNVANHPMAIIQRTLAGAGLAMPAQGA
ncbi:MAG TPA: hypothetical protein VGF49_16395 [Candidatus Solibacter sp.]|jgi:hypothetical protein